MIVITVYSTGPACMQCTMTKRALHAAGLAFTEVNIREKPAAFAYVTEDLGYAQAPVVVVDHDGEAAGERGQDHWSGFQPDQITRVARLLGEGPA